MSGSLKHHSWRMLRKGFKGAHKKRRNAAYLHLDGDKRAPSQNETPTYAFCASNTGAGSANGEIWVPLPSQSEGRKK